MESTTLIDLEKIRGMQSLAKDIDGLVKGIDTVADFATMKGTPKKVYVSGYHEKNDGAFGSNFFVLREGVVPNGSYGNTGTVFESPLGVYDLQFEGVGRAEWFGVIPSNYKKAENNADALNKALTVCDIELENRSYYIGKQIVVQDFSLTAKSLKKAVLIQSSSYIGDVGTPFLKITNGNYKQINNIHLYSSKKTYIGFEIGYPVNRSKITNLIASGFSTGIIIDGWINEIGKLYVDNCLLGVKIVRSNGNNIDMIAIENCDKYLEIGDDIVANSSTGNNINMIMLESTTETGGSIPSTIDNINSLNINSIYLESGDIALSTIFKIGSIQRVKSLTINQVSSYTKIKPDNYIFELFDTNNVTIDGFVKRTSVPLVKVNNGTEDFKDNLMYATSNYSAKRKVLNYVPNSDFVGGIILAPKIQLDSTDVTMTLDKDISKDKAIKLVANADITSSFHLRFKYSDYGILDNLKGKKICFSADTFTSVDTGNGIKVSGYTSGGSKSAYQIDSYHQDVNIITNEYLTEITPPILIDEDRTYLEIFITFYASTNNPIPAGTVFFAKNFFIGEFEKQKIINKDYVEAPGTDISVEKQRLVWTIPQDTTVEKFNRKGDSFYTVGDPTSVKYCQNDGDAMSAWT